MLLRGWPRRRLELAGQRLVLGMDPECRMRKYILAAGGAVGTAVVGKVVDVLFPAVWPKVVNLLLLDVPAWTLGVAVGVSLLFGARLWSNRNPANVEKSQSTVQIKPPAFAPGVHEDQVLKLFGHAQGAAFRKHLDASLRDLSQRIDLTLVELNHAVRSLCDADWLEESFVGPYHDLQLTLSPEAARYCRAKGWMRSNTDSA